MVHAATDASSVRVFRHEGSAEIELGPHEKWPVWLRIVVIVSLSGTLWAGIIAAISALL